MTKLTYVVPVLIIALASYMYLTSATTPSSYNPPANAGPPTVPSGPPGPPSTDPSTIRSPESEPQAGAEDSYMTL